MLKRRYEVRPIDNTTGLPFEGNNAKYYSKRRALAVAASTNHNSASFVYDISWRVYDVKSGTYL